ncbi:hypothetical protein, partial [uncultured Acetobacterium sp.]|uniref:hypothetical protein n=1 Tax=uncultured Acetobacterium sp. TaxID=217139 RepID=UPI0025E6245B
CKTQVFALYRTDQLLICCMRAPQEMRYAYFLLVHRQSPTTSKLVIGSLPARRIRQGIACSP